jgi:multiple antibiotic resistance protein
MNATLYGSVVVTLFVIMDPIGIIPVFLALVGKRPPAEAHRLAWQAALTSLAVISGFAIFGDAILSYLHISLPALRVAGGLLLLVVALQLLMRGEIQSSATADNANIALVPLGTPLLAGPGAIVAAILFVRDASTPGDLATIAAGIATIHLIIFLVLRFSTTILRVVREAGVTVISRIAGVLLAAIAVQLTADGIHDFIVSWQ